MDKYLIPEDDGLSAREFGIWTTEKLDYLERYINMFEVSMHQRPWCARCYIDLFAGTGKYRPEGQKDIRLGSALIALTTKYPFTHYFFVDKYQENIDILKKRSNNTGLSSKFLVGDANTKVGEVVNEIKSIENNRPKNSWSSLNLAFLDPDGLELEWKTVAELASIKKMDLIIYYSQSGLTRNLDKFSNTHEENIIDRFFGDREWRRIFNDFKNSTGYIDT